MSPSELGALITLALIDSTSFGTLVVPLVMMLAPRVRAARVLLYLVTIALFYLGLGLALLAGTVWARQFGSSVSQFFASTPVYVAQAVLGVALVAISFRYDKAPMERRKAARQGRPTRWEAWRAQAMGPEATPGATIGLALGAGLVEAASMLPYLGALALITRAGVSMSTGSLVLGGYVVVMILPAILLLGLRLVLQTRVESRLQRLSDWLQQRSAGALGWVIGLVGVLLALDAIRVLGERGVI